MSAQMCHSNQRSSSRPSQQPETGLTFFSIPHLPLMILRSLSHPAQCLERASKSTSYHSPCQKDISGDIYLLNKIEKNACPIFVKNMRLCQGPPSNGSHPAMIKTLRHLRIRKLDIWKSCERGLGLFPFFCWCFSGQMSSYSSKCMGFKISRLQRL